MGLFFKYLPTYILNYCQNVCEISFRNYPSMKVLKYLSVYILNKNTTISEGFSNTFLKILSYKFLKSSFWIQDFANTLYPTILQVCYVPTLSILKSESKKNIHIDSYNSNLTSDNVCINFKILDEMFDSDCLKYMQ